MSKRLGSFRLHLVAAPSYLAERGEPTKLSDLAQHACLHYRYPSSGKLEPWPVRHSKTAAGELTLRMTVVVSSLEALLYLAQGGRGIACLPDVAVKAALDAGQLKTVLDSHMTRSTTFWILWPSSKQMTPKVRAFVDFVVHQGLEGLFLHNLKKRMPRMSEAFFQPKRTAEFLHSLRSGFLKTIISQRKVTPTQSSPAVSPKCHTPPG